jgi:hypothetical protein
MREAADSGTPDRRPLRGLALWSRASDSLCERLAGYRWLQRRVRRRVRLGGATAAKDHADEWGLLARWVSGWPCEKSGDCDRLF